MWTEVRKVVPCVVCGRDSKKHSVKKKMIHIESGKKELIVSEHYCTTCNKHFTNPAGEKYAPIRRNVSWGIIRMALSLSETLTLEKTSSEVLRKTGYRVSPTTLYDWIKGKEKLLQKMEQFAVFQTEKEI